MSRKEVPRPGLVKLTVTGQITNAQGAQSAHLSIRQFQRLKAPYRTDGIHGVRHGRRGQPSLRAPLRHGQGEPARRPGPA